jgi:hypothetical protein
VDLQKSPIAQVLLLSYFNMETWSSGLKRDGISRRHGLPPTRGSHLIAWALVEVWAFRLVLLDFLVN